MRKQSQIKAAEVSGLFASLQLMLLRAAGAFSEVFKFPGMRRLTWVVAPLFNSQNTAVLELPFGGRLEIFLNDGYWSKLLKNGYIYEPGLDSILRRVLARPDTYFLDCGANIGYWSVIASQLLPPGRVVALEASPPQFERLRRNIRINDSRIEAVPGALWSKDGDTLVIVTNERWHAGSSVVNWRDKVKQARFHEYNVESITIDSICERFIPDCDAKIVIKLDVEGAEVQALQGAQRVLSSRDVIVLYEDHGQDPTCKASKFILDDLGFDILYCDEDSAITRIQSLAEVESIKTDVTVGYNFCAYARDSVFSKMLATHIH